MAITRVQSATGTGSTTTCAVTLGSSPTNGNFLVATIGTTSTTANPVSSITQTGATWTKAVTVDNANGESMDIWYAMNVSGASTSITINLAGTLSSCAVVAEYSGGKTTGLLDQTASNQGDNNTGLPDTGTTATTIQNNELWLGGLGLISGSGGWGTPTNGFVNVANAANGIIVIMEEKIVASKGTANTSNQMTVMTNPNHWAGAMATFLDVNPGNRYIIIS